jgi:Major Facilitator Superfamily
MPRHANGRDKCTSISGAELWRTCEVLRTIGSAPDSNRCAVNSASATLMGPSSTAVAVICAAEILCLLGYSIVPALLPQFIEAWSLTNTQAGCLAGIVSAGYMLAVIPLVSLTDRRPARQLYLASSALSALSCFGMALSDSLLPALGFRALAGIAMAGMYMPGLRALTHGSRGSKPRPNCGLVHQLLHDRRVAVVPVRPGRNAAGLAQRFCYPRHARPPAS